MEGDSGVSRSIIDEILPSDIQGSQKERESCVTGTNIDELYF